MPHPPSVETAAHVRRQDRRKFIVVMIALAAMLFVVAETLLFYRWATVTEPTCVLIVDTGEALRGWEVVVDGFTLSAPYKATIGAGGRYAMPFYLEPGEYNVRIQRDDQVLFDRRIPLMPPVRGKRIDLTSVRPAPATTRASGGQVS